MDKKVSRFILMAALLLVTAGQSSAQYRVVIDTKAIKIVGENAASAKLAEGTYKAELDSIKEKRSTLLLNTAVRNMVKSARMAQQTYLGDLGEEQEAYKKLVRVCERFLEASEALYEEGSKHPAAALGSYRMIGVLALDAMNTVHRCVKVAMGGKVKNPFKALREKMEQSSGFSPFRLSSGKKGNTVKDDGEDGDDGYNLIYADERLMLVYETIDHLNKLSRAMEVLTFELATKWTWREMLRDADPEGYSLAMKIVYDTQDIGSELERLPFW